MTSPRQATSDQPVDRRRSILFISCYELGHQPLAVASPRGFLRRAGYETEVMDLAVERFDSEPVARAWLVAISVPMHTALRLGVPAAERIRRINPACHICFYGLYASLNADYLLDHVADSVIGGEFEEPLTDLVETLAVAGAEHPDGDGAGVNTSPPEVNGASFSRKLAAPFLKRLDFAVPDRSGLPSLQRYAHIERDGGRGLVGYVEASRGCLHRCLHCPIPPVYEGRFFVMPIEVVLEDIKRQVGAGAIHITFGDPDFLNGPGHSLRLARAMQEEFPAISFDFTTKVEHLLKRGACLPEFAELGCLFIVSAFESLSDTVLGNLGKGHTRADIYAALEVVRDAGISLRPTWVPFTPWTTMDDYIDILEFVRTEGLTYQVDPVQYAIRLLIPPGSALLERPWVKPVLGALDEANFTYHWSHSDARMDELQCALSALLERAADAGEDPAVIFNRVRRMVYAARGDEAPAPVSLAGFGQRSRPPRLTESWFC